VRLQLRKESDPVFSLPPHPPPQLVASFSHFSVEYGRINYCKLHLSSRRSRSLVLRHCGTSSSSKARPSSSAPPPPSSCFSSQH